ncbi:hypothetical protein ABIF61_004304 [Bradyrhizobium japonicum]
MPDQQNKPARSVLLRIPLFRLLAINLAIGACAAALLVGGLLWLNPGHLRELIFADSSPGIALALLLASFLITFGSAAMGSAIMAQGLKEHSGKGGGHGSRLAARGAGDGAAHAHALRHERRRWNPLLRIGITLSARRREEVQVGAPSDTARHARCIAKPAR